MRQNIGARRGFLSLACTLQSSNPAKQSIVEEIDLRRGNVRRNTVTVCHPASATPCPNQQTLLQTILVPRVVCRRRRPAFSQDVKTHQCMTLVNNSRFVVCDPSSFLPQPTGISRIDRLRGHIRAHMFEPDGGQQNARSSRKTVREPGQNPAVPIIAEM